MKVSDFHCHFFSSSFLRALGLQAGLQESEGLAVQVARRLEWEPPGSNRELARRWIREMDLNDVARIGLIASLPGEEVAVAEALKEFPERFVGQFMADPHQSDAPEVVRVGLQERGFRVVCLFPAMHHFRLDSDAVLRIFEIVHECRGAAFVHCGVLSVGARKKLGLASPFDIRLGNPLDLHRAASAFPNLPIVIPHFGAGFFREALFAADRYPRIYLDTSSSNAWTRYFPNLDLKSVFATALAVLGPDRLLFGTDSSFFPRGWQTSVLEVQQQILHDLEIPPAEQEAVLWRNFEQLFPLS